MTIHPSGDLGTSWDQLDGMVELMSALLAERTPRARLTTTTTTRGDFGVDHSDCNTIPVCMCIPSPHKGCCWQDIADKNRRNKEHVHARALKSPRLKEKCGITNCGLTSRVISPQATRTTQRSHHLGDGGMARPGSSDSQTTPPPARCR